MTNDNTLSESEVELCAKEFLNSGKPHLLFQSKENRDAVYRMCRKLFPRTELKRSSTGHQLLDPRYTFEGSHLPDLGLANDYRHSFSNLYELSKPRSW